MKKILLISMFLLSFLLNANAQHGKSKSSKFASDSKIGLGITASGVIFTVAGFVTPPDYTWVQNNTGSAMGYWKKKPFMEQGSRSMCIVTGITLTLSGAITMLTGN